MKLNRMLSASVLGLSLLATSAFACEPSSNSRSGEGTSWSLTGWFHNLVAESHRECDQNGQDSGRGNNCDHGRGNGGGYCGTGSSTSGGSSTGGSTGGSTGSSSGGSTGGGTVGPKG
jgi:hypothetical protein